MKVAAALIAAVTVLAALGSLIPQMPPPIARDPNAEAKWLAEAASRLAPLYHRLGLFRFYETIWFRGPLVLLVVSTFLCTVDRIKVLWRQAFHPSPRRSREFFTNARLGATLSAPSGETALETLRGQLKEMGLRHIVAVEGDGARFLYADRNRFAALATLVTHLGLVALIPCALVAWTMGWEERGIILLPGQRYTLSHNPALALQSDNVELQRDTEGRVRDYRSTLTIWEDERRALTGVLNTGKPLGYRGIAIHQWGYGPAVSVQAVGDGGQGLRLCRGDADCSEGVISLSLTAGESGLAEARIPALATTIRVTPETQSAGYFVQILQDGQPRPLREGYIGGGEEFRLPGLTLRFIREDYVVLKASYMPGAAAAWFILLVISLSMAVSFYWPHDRLWAQISPSGEVLLAALPGGEAKDFAQRFRRFLKACAKSLERQL